MSEYANLLRSPLWQKKRLEILGIRGFKCEECGNTERELHVHPRWYEKGLKPWEYHDEVYAVLCTDCHKKRHSVEQKLRIELGRQETRSLETLDMLLRFLGDPTAISCAFTSFVIRDAAEREGFGTLTSAQRDVLGSEWMAAITEHIEASKEMQEATR